MFNRGIRNAIMVRLNWFREIHIFIIFQNITLNFEVIWNIDRFFQIDSSHGSAVLLFTMLSIFPIPSSSVSCMKNYCVRSSHCLILFEKLVEEVLIDERTCILFLPEVEFWTMLYADSLLMSWQLQVLSTISLFRQ